jgi:hypothetical protein
MKKNVEDYKPMVNVAYIAKGLGKGVVATKDIIEKFDVDHIHYMGKTMIKDSIADKFIQNYKNKIL